MNERLGPRVYTVRQVREMTGFCNDTVYKYIRSGALVARKCGRKTLILADDLDQFLNGLPTLRLGREAA